MLNRSLLFLILLTGNYSSLFSQLQNDMENKSKNVSIFVELGGNTSFVSLNLEKRLLSFEDMHFDFRVGYGPGRYYGTSVFPASFSVFFGNQNHLIELGAGVLIYQKNDLIYVDHNISPPPFFRVMYRYVSKKGFIFGAGITPYRNQNNAKLKNNQWIGLDFGYSL